ncbi:hypothetical protein O181_066392 [Austropuccinia psidii MF-1]|uniref:Chromo domain-containing protein n=1 Tax=Austropuccinia psidii MF-1 TaxID=1389203 RepID=A0A9Q3I494_9BASI|nr:hypothetical protein [Austropuccinia psidii MF-1]
MNHPPSSYHDSLEEFWDEEEEPEEIKTVMKVVPSVYHKYLDVFSKVKAEKIPPHRTCDHHIELEWSLPPVGVIYSLSNQESDTLRAYISENVEKGFIRPSSSSTGAPVLFVKNKDGGLRKHPIAFDSHKHLLAELNYEIHDKELFGIVWALKRWRAFLLSLASSFEVLTNHSSLQYFISSKILTRRQAHWAESHSSNTYRPGHLSTIPDALSSWDDIYPERGGTFHQQESNELSKNNQARGTSSLKKELWKDSQYRSILQYLGKDKSVQDYFLDSSSQLLLFKGWVVFPNDPTIQLSILQKRHDSPLAGHPGQEKTLKLVQQDFHWHGMTQFTKDYVSSHQQCSRKKNIHHKKYGLLPPLPIPNGPWICISMNLITQLPLSNSFDSILVIVDRFSKMAVFIPTMSSITSLDLAHLFIKNIFSKHGLPSSINSDHSSTKQSLFFPSYGRYPHFDSVHITQDTPAAKLSTKFQSVQQDVKRELQVSINSYKRYADKSRAGPPVFNPGDMKVRTHAYHLKLPSQWKSIHPVFHISLLEPVKTSKISNRRQKPPSPIIIEEEEEWEVSQILDSKLKRGEFWYLVEWKGFSQGLERSTWEQTENLKNFHSLYHDKPGPNSSRA